MTDTSPAGPPDPDAEFDFGLRVLIRGLEGELA